MAAVLSEHREEEERLVSLAAGLDLPHTGVKQGSSIAGREARAAQKLAEARVSAALLCFYIVIRTKSDFPIHLN